MKNFSNFELLALFIVIPAVMLFFYFGIYKHAPNPQMPGLKAFIATYKTEPIEPYKTEYSKKVFVNCDGKRYIRKDVGPESPYFLLYDLQRHASYDVDKSKHVYTHREMITPESPIPFTLGILLDEKSAQREADYKGNAIIDGHQCHYYNGGSTAGTGTYNTWYCPDLNCSVKVEVRSDYNGYYRETLLDYKSEMPDAKLFDLAGYKEIPAREYYKRQN